jgi:hypothetical protein
MNEQIKQLKHQASLWCDENIPEQYSEETNGYGLAWEYKFAELIKQAIYDKVKEELIPDDIIAEEQAHHQEYLKGCNAGIVDSLCHIKNFGVEQ